MNATLGGVNYSLVQFCTREQTYTRVQIVHMNTALDDPILDNKVHTSINDSRSRNVTRKRRKWNNWLDDVTFDWRHAMGAAFVRNNQIRRFIIFLRCFFLQDLHQNFTIWTKMM